jgi:hypothetical protein
MPHSIDSDRAWRRNGLYLQGGRDFFPGRPLERRFRDIHTLSQQIQSRDAQ